MEQRHQVFISSTYGDLKEERAEIIQALLELDCIPAGMELFPAATAAAWDLIKGVIDDSDYYCLVIAGRYGSVDAGGISYTEKEYDYAVSQGKPVMAFFHAEPGTISSSKTEKTEQGQKRLEQFRKKVEQSHHRKQWTTATELGGLVSRGLVNMRKANPSEGWVRGRFAATDAMLVEMANLRARVAELSAAATPSSPLSADVQGLASGTDTYPVSAHFTKMGAKDRVNEIIDVSWDMMLRYVGPVLVNECSEQEFLDKLKLCVYHAGEVALNIEISHSTVIIPTVVIDRIKVQLQALGYMAAGLKRRAVSDKTTYWRLTDDGHRQLIKALAIRKPDKASTAIEKVLESITALPKIAPIALGGPNPN